MISKDMIEALVAIQTDLKNTPRTAENKFMKYSYTTLDVILDTVKPVLKAHKLVVIQTVETQKENGLQAIVTRLLHEDGGLLETTFILPPADVKGANEIQQLGASITYGRRYALTTLLGIASDDDNDAVTPPQKQTQSAQAQKKAERKSPAPAPPKDDISFGNPKQMNQQQRKIIFGLSFAIWPKDRFNTFEKQSHFLKELGYTPRVDDLWYDQAETVIKKMRQIIEEEQQAGGGY